MTIQAPYRFVPLSNLVVLPDWAEQVSHDKPFKDGICGELEIEIITHGKVCVGGIQTASSEQAAGRVYFYKTPDDKVAIPGSSLKGMLRNVLEIATFSRFKQVEDQKLGVRDISEANNFYAQAIVNNTQAGWLKFENHQWVIYPCSFARVHQKDIVNYFDNLTYQQWRELKTVQQRYQRLGVCPTINYKDSGNKKYNKVLAELKVDGNLSGSLVMTGQPGTFYQENNPNQPPSAKKYEFVFYSKLQESLKIPTQVMSGFRQIHEETKEWKFWLEKLPTLAHGIPVFFHKDGQEIKSLGLAMMYKLAYKNSIYDAINHTCNEHINSQQQEADLADLIFGYLGENNQRGLRGRVNIGLASCTSEPPLSFTQATVLSGPKPTYYPHYIQQNNTRAFNQLMQNSAKVSGWKRYPVKSVDFPELAPLVVQNTKVQVKLETVDQDTPFLAKIRLHNLRPVELGALLWCLDFGGRKDLRHNIGMGKPYGLGQISLSIHSSKLRLNHGQLVQDKNVFLQACRLEFENYMDQIIQQIKPNSRWKDTGEIKALLSYADPSNKLALDYLPTPKAFADLRKKERLEEFIQEFHDFQSLELSTQTQLNVSYVNQLNSQIDKVQEIAKKQVIAEERNKLKNEASPEDEIIYTLEDFLAQAEIELTKTIKKKANKMFKTPFEESWVYFNDEQKSKFKQLADKADVLIGDNGLSSTVKKIKLAE
ncbi:TIGR03986 family CRISPR-associated RAMP protein [Acinetobacter sichuanensis]|uniref:TIGR03986 family type III CRISPR-associated RAMP protein n=1 Tax=Acinetobacter sichuanensis TaxID=2136183 RepID=UPI00280EB9B6|nr:TIGR03986 family CRISPR-associated RAMP protein [Acinetobacter sichuanensis]MDQ9021838.1 TIGR03986 family CRISPR-associated RAMP protein [Acinetobacter sichuanensis]